jgi:hypothetical protein
MAIRRAEFIERRGTERNDGRRTVWKERREYLIEGGSKKKRVRQYDTIT